MKRIFTPLISYFAFRVFALPPPLVTWISGHEDTHDEENHEDEEKEEGKTDLFYYL